MRKLIIILTVAALAGAAAAGAGTTDITGFVDAAYFWGTYEKNGEFSIDQVEVDILHRASEKTRVRADLEWIRIGHAFEANIEQAFMVYTLPHEWDITFGKFNAPMGFELLDPNEMYQYSHALVFDFGLPTNLVGASVAKAFGPGFDIIAHVSNGWDVNAMAGDNVTLGGRLGYANGGFGGGVSYIDGTQESILFDGDDPLNIKRQVLDIDASFRTGIWLFGGEYNQGTATQELTTGDVDKDWTGFLLMTNISYASWTGLTLRYDTFDDKDARIFDLVDGQSQNIQSITICPTFSLDENFGALVEFRWFKSDRMGFTDKDGEATDTNTHIAFEATYSW